MGILKGAAASWVAHGSHGVTVKFQRCFNAAEWCDAIGDDVVPALAADVAERDAPQGHGVLVADDGRLAGRCSVWWARTPAVDGRPVGAIGHYAARDAAAGVRLLDEACAWLKEQRCAVALGPMDGDTWRTYRAVVAGDGQPFFLEPWHSTDCAAHFTQAGFSTHATYCSTICDDMTFRDPRAGRAAARLARAGVVVRPLAMARLDEQMRAIHEVTLAAFAKTPLYRPIAWDAMRRLYEPLLERLDPSLVLLAYREEQVVGFVFGFPDYRQAQRGEAVDTAILKTLAILPGQQLGGLGGVLIAAWHDAAEQAGMRRAIHALMHEQNRDVLGLSLRYGPVLRRYAVFMRELW